MCPNPTKSMDIQFNWLWLSNLFQVGFPIHTWPTCSFSFLLVPGHSCHNCSFLAIVAKLGRRVANGHSCLLLAHSWPAASLSGSNHAALLREKLGRGLSSLVGQTQLLCSWLNTVSCIQASEFGCPSQQRPLLNKTQIQSDFGYIASGLQIFSSFKTWHHYESLCLWPAIICWWQGRV